MTAAEAARAETAMQDYFRQVALSEAEFQAANDLFHKLQDYREQEYRRQVELDRQEALDRAITQEGWQNEQ